jgi:ABC-type lipoprotein export system ATPase subunit
MIMFDEQNICIQNTILYLDYKKKVGSFWALYLMGIKSISDIKFTLSFLAIQTLLGIISSFLSNKLIMQTKSIDYHILICTIIICNLDKPILKIINLWLYPKSNFERRLISKRIADWVHNIFNQSDYKWRRDNPDNTQRDAIESIFHTYIGITWNLAYMITSSIDTIVFTLIAFYNSWFIGFIIVLGSFILYKIRKCYNYQLEKVDQNITNDCKNIRLKNSNQYTLRIDRLINPRFESLMKPFQYDPVNGLVENVGIWDSRDCLAENQQLINEITKSIMIVLASLYLIYDRSMILWIIINGSKLFGAIDIISRLDEMKNLSSTHILTYLKIIDDLNLEQKISLSELNIIEKSSTIEKIKNLYSIKIGQINWKISDDLYLRSLGPINIDIDNNNININNLETCPKIILLNGPKGSGKSLTMDILAGQYDGLVCDKSMKINDKYISNEFKSEYFVNNRIYVQQLVSDRYRNNKICSISMTLRELFPGATYDEIRDYLFHFDMVKKMPTANTTKLANTTKSAKSTKSAQTIFDKTTTDDLLDIVLGENERSFSPGEIQALVLASQLYKAFILGTKLLLLDEPERNIDYETFEKIFNNIINKFKGTIIMITHNDKLKQFLKDKKMIKQIWQFEGVANELRFKAHNIKSKFIGSSR